ncbi:MAG TPA: aldo/keto reductase [Bacteroidales bacterium]|nr:aldo/keto reductase [Bacteroidales bacterium]
MNTNSRRSFLKNSFIGISGTALIPSITASAGVKTINELPVRKLGKTGIQVPLISMGTSGASSTGFIKAAYDAGIRLFFSATYYGEGNNEILVGQALKDIPRSSYMVGTAASPDGMDMRSGTLSAAFTSEGYIKKAEESLKRFGMEQIDFVLLPFAGKKETVLHEGVLKAFEQLKKQGKVKYVGIASHSDSIEALDAAASSDIYDVAMIGYNFKSPDLEAYNQAIKRAAKAGIGIVGMKTTAGAGRNKTGPAVNVTAALKWVLKNEDITSIVSGMSSLDELQKNMAMLKNLNMTEQEINDLKLASVEMNKGLYCRQCKECIPQCPNELDIPTLMRSYMYAYGYKNREQAWYTLADAGIKGNPCSSCDGCNVNCSSGFDVKERITDIARLSDVPVEFVRA